MDGKRNDPTEPMNIDHTCNSSTLNKLVDLTQQRWPTMSESLEKYLEGLVRDIGVTEFARDHNQRTTDTTVTLFDQTQRDRLWKLKTNDQLVDSVLVTADGTFRETVHIDMLRSMSKEMPSFLSKTSQVDSVTGLDHYSVDSTISEELLREVIYFAYHKQCSLTSHNATQLAEIGAKFECNSLLQYCLAFLIEHCAPSTVIRGLVLSSMDKFPNHEANRFFRRYIEDNFEQIWTDNPTDLCSLTFANIRTFLQWDKLFITSEVMIWLVIQAWVNHNRSDRLAHLSELIKATLRFGRLPEQYLKESVFGSECVRAMSDDSRHELQQFVDRVLHGELRKQTIVDGHHLPYAKSVFYFRPRETRQLLIAAGGWTEGQTTKTIELYDYQLNVWRSTTFQLPSTVSYFGFESVGSTLYVFGGSNGREIYKLVSALDLSEPHAKWVSMCSMIERRCYVSSVVVGDSVYAFGGFNGQRRIRKCEKFDLHSNTWSEIADLNYARSDASAAALNGRIYVAGGINDSNIEHSVEVYHVASNHWQLVKHMNHPRTSFALTAFGDRIWAVGGNDGERRLNSTESYDPLLDVWKEEALMVHARSTFRATTLNGELYVVGGYNGENPVRACEKYSSDKRRWTLVTSLLHERSGLSLISLPNQYDVLRV